jgi:hypothetical protein
MVLERMASSLMDRVDSMTCSQNKMLEWMLVGKAAGPQPRALTALLESRQPRDSLGSEVSQLPVPPMAFPSQPALTWSAETQESSSPDVGRAAAASDQGSSAGLGIGHLLDALCARKSEKADAKAAAKAAAKATAVAKHTGHAAAKHAVKAKAATKATTKTAAKAIAKATANEIPAAEVPAKAVAKATAEVADTTQAKAAAEATAKAAATKTSVANVPAKAVAKATADVADTTPAKAAAKKTVKAAEKQTAKVPLKAAAKVAATATAKDASVAKEKSVAALPAFPKAATKHDANGRLILGCSKCRWKRAGCSQCHNDAFNGLRGNPGVVA